MGHPFNFHFITFMKWTYEWRLFFPQFVWFPQTPPPQLPVRNKTKQNKTIHWNLHFAPLRHSQEGRKTTTVLLSQIPVQPTPLQLANCLPKNGVRVCNIFCLLYTVKLSFVLNLIVINIFDLFVYLKNDIWKNGFVWLVLYLKCTNDHFAQRLVFVPLSLQTVF